MVNKMLYNGMDLSHLLKVGKVTKGWLPPHQLSSLSISGKAGAWFARKKHGIRIIKVDVGVIADTKEELYQKIDDLAYIFNVDKPKKLSFTDQPGRYWMAILEGETEEDRRGLLMRNQLNLVCFDPYGYSKVPDIYGKQVNNQGTAPAHPIITATLTESSSDLIVKHQTTGRIMRVIRDFSAGDVVVINCETGKVTVNDSLAMGDIDKTTIKFFELEKGQHEISATPSTTQVKVELTKRWL